MVCVWERGGTHWHNARTYASPNTHHSPRRLGLQSVPLSLSSMGPIGPPKVSASHLQFTDTDGREGTLAGYITWAQPATGTATVSHYAIFFATSVNGAGKVQQGDDHAVGNSNAVVLAAGTAKSIFTHILVYARNRFGFGSVAPAAQVISDYVAPVAAVNAGLSGDITLETQSQRDTLIAAVAAQTLAAVDPHARSSVTVLAQLERVVPIALLWPGSATMGALQLTTANEAVLRAACGHPAVPGCSAETHRPSRSHPWRRLQTPTQGCVCADVESAWGQGKSCRDVGFDGRFWCYVAPGACMDGKSSEKMPGYHWSYMACENRASPAALAQRDTLEGEVTLAMVNTTKGYSALVVSPTVPGIFLAAVAAGVSAAAAITGAIIPVPDPSAMRIANSIPRESIRARVMVADAATAPASVAIDVSGMALASVPYLTVTAETCGDGEITSEEACDDANTSNGDGCTSDCRVVEPGFVCPTAGAGCQASVCGDGILGDQELCDDGNNVGGDGCFSDCSGTLAGYLCVAPGSACAPVCGDSIVAGAEVCDDGNARSRDGCHSSCMWVEDHHVCMVPGLPCTPLPVGFILFSPEPTDPVEWGTRIKMRAPDSEFICYTTDGTAAACWRGDGEAGCPGTAKRIPGPVGWSKGLTSPVRIDARGCRGRCCARWGLFGGV